MTALIKRDDRSKETAEATWATRPITRPIFADYLLATKKGAGYISFKMYPAPFFSDVSEGG
jgi:hypothetical protein